MTRARHLALILLLLYCAVGLAAQTRGQGRIAGKVLDDSGKPAADVQVRALKQGESQEMRTNTNEKGEWALNGIAGGQWNLEFNKAGFDSQRVTIQVSETERNPAIELKLSKPAPDPNVEIQAELKKAVAMQQAGQNAEARKVYEALLAKHPTLYQLNSYIAGTYAAEKNYDKALEHLKVVSEKDPANIDLKLLMADLLMEKGEKVEAQKILESIDMAQVKDPTIYINLAIGSINANKPDEAIATLEKINKQFPTRADVFYYRARAYIVAKKPAEAKADLEKFISMAAPDARELADAKKLLEQLKDVK
jgi:predicted Zn-dependent protease